MPTPPQIRNWAPLRAPLRDKRWAAVEGARLSGDFKVPAMKVDSPLVAVNKLLNDLIRYRPDDFDKWEEPDKTWEEGYGDCEDIAILKRALLLKAGVKDEKIWFVIARSKFGGQDHALLLVEWCGHHYWVDNTNGGSIGLTTDGGGADQGHGVSRVTHNDYYIPRFAYQGEQVWTYGKKK